MPNAIRFHKSVGPEVLVSEPVPIGKPGPGEARVRHTAVGVNFVGHLHPHGPLSRGAAQRSWCRGRRRR